MRVNQRTAAQGQLHAYVDRIADNAPSTDSRITVTTADIARLYEQSAR